MTLAELKRDLPSVPVAFCGIFYRGQVTGRLNDCATVTVFSLDNHWRSWQYAWQAVLEAITKDKPLRPQRTDKHEEGAL